MACSTGDGGPKRIMPPTYFLAALVLAIASRFALPALAFSSVVTLVVGALLLVAGIALNLASDSAFKREGTPVGPDAVPSAFVATGAFRVTRNPMYLGMVLIVGAAALMCGAPVGVLAGVALLWALNRFFVPREERNLERAFGSQYADYRVSVPRWI